MAQCTRSISLVTVLLSVSAVLCSFAVASAEDVALRTRADQLLEQGRAANKVRDRVAGIRTEATFQATADGWHASRQS